MTGARIHITPRYARVVNSFNSNLTNAFLEGMNSLIQATKSRARGYRSNRNFIAMAYLIGAKPDFELPTHETAKNQIFQENQTGKQRWDMTYNGILPSCMALIFLLNTETPLSSRLRGFSGSG